MAAATAAIECHQLLVPIVDREPIRATVFDRTEAPEIVAPAGHLRVDVLMC
jgi:hypothetical protein